VESIDELVKQVEAVLNQPKDPEFEEILKKAKENAPLKGYEIKGLDESRCASCPYHIEHERRGRSIVYTGSFRNI
jgi:hypothetical protein